MSCFVLFELDQFNGYSPNEESKGACNEGKIVKVSVLIQGKRCDTGITSHIGLTICITSRRAMQANRTRITVHPQL
jgi:hypothetical protein